MWLSRNYLIFTLDQWTQSDFSVVTHGNREWDSSIFEWPLSMSTDLPVHALKTSH